MQFKSQSKPWIRHAAIALCAFGLMISTAHATGTGSGRITFSGALVTPTCGVSQGSVQQASQNRTQAVNVSCPVPQHARAAGASSYRLRVTRLDSNMVDPRVQTYFPQQFTPQAGAMVAVQTYR